MEKIKINLTNTKMKTIKLLIFLAMIAGMFSANTFAQSRKSDITSFYYYEGQPYYLKLNPGKVFVKFSKNITAQDFNRIAGEYSSLFSTGNFDEKENMQIVSLNTSMDNIMLSSVVEMMKLKEGIDYVSPVFNMPEGQGSAMVEIGLINEIIVQFNPNVSQKAASDFALSRGLVLKQEIKVSGGLSYIYTIPSDLNSMDVANDIHNSEIVKSSEPNFFFTNLLNYTPNDPFYPMQWSVRNTGSNIPTGVIGTDDCDMDVDSAWNITLGSNSVIVGMVDSGIDTLHEDISPNLIPGTGYNFYSNTPGGMDDQNHGTATAGIVGAVGNNLLGTSGISPNCKMIAIKIFNSGGNTTSGAIINGLNYSWQQGEYVSSNSWGGGSPIALANQAITDGSNMGRGGKGTLFVFATGNDNGAVSWPATRPEVLAVGGNSPCNTRKSTSSCDGETWWGANYGTGLHIVAPCVKVYSPDRTGSVGYSSGNYYNQFNGTSSATPNVAGVCALMFAVDPDMRWDTVRARIDRFADKVGPYTYSSAGPIGIGGWNNEMGYGKVNAYRSIKYTQDNLGPVIAHIPLSNTENLSGPYNVNALITSTNGAINPSTTKLFYTSSVAYDSVVLINTIGDTWSASIPGTGSPATYKYYLRAEDMTGAVSYLPSNAPTNFMSFNAFVDTQKPVITHSAIGDQPKALWPVAVSADVTDNIGLDSVWVKWYKNSPATLKQFKLINTTGNTFAAAFNSLNSDVAANDFIYYRIFAQDNSASHNVDSSALYNFQLIDLPLCEDFLSPTFAPVNWTIDFSGTSYWTRNAASGYATGSGSAKFDFWSASAGTTQSLITLTFGSSVAGDTLKFDYANASYTSASSVDSLIIETSTNGGSSYTQLVRLKSGPADTVGGVTTFKTVAASGSAFTPSTSSQWRTKRYLLPAGTNKVKFRARSGFGNNLYLDNICKTNTILAPVPATITLAPQGYYDQVTNRLTIRDSVKIYLRNIVAPYTLVDSASALIDSVTMSASVTFTNAMTGNYYVIATGRNYVETWSLDGGSAYTRGSAFSYDFTTAQSQSYGNNSVLKGSEYCIYNGDVVRNNVVDLNDIVQIYNKSAVFGSGYDINDLNGDRLVNLNDIVLVLNNSSNFVTRVAPAGALSPANEPQVLVKPIVPSEETFESSIIINEKSADSKKSLNGNVKAPVIRETVKEGNKK